jgi:hypothetical protein
MGVGVPRMWRARNVASEIDQKRYSGPYPMVASVDREQYCPIGLGGRLLSDIFFLKVKAE